MVALALQNIPALTQLQLDFCMVLVKPVLSLDIPKSMQDHGAFQD